MRLVFKSVFLDCGRTRVERGHGSSCFSSNA